MFFKARSQKSKPSKPGVRTVAIGGREVPLTVRADRRAKRLTLRIEPGGRALKMTVPIHIAHYEVDRFLERQHDWLTKKLSSFAGDEALVNGSTIMLRGENYRIISTGKLRGLTTFGERDGEKVIEVSGDHQHLGRRLRDFLKKEARKDLEKLAALHAKASGRKYVALSLKDTRSRWGSCTHDGRLSFSWRIVMAPPFVIDYLAAHEVAHLTEMNHSADFWALCEKLCPATDEAKMWLKANGSALHAIDFN